MCRSIVTLRGAEPATDDEVQAAALQFVRKVSGQRGPSQANRDVFDRAVDEIAGATRRLLDDLVVRPGARPPAMPRSRVVARERGREKSVGHLHGAEGHVHGAEGHVHTVDTAV